MYRTAGHLRFAGFVVGLILCSMTAGVGGAQMAEGSFSTGAATRAWEKWDAALQAVLNRDAEATESAFGELLASDPSPFRIALLADHTVQHTANGGAVLLLEQDFESGALGENGSAVVEQLLAGREQMNEADDGWYFCQIGRFDVAEANFQALLKSEPDPVALLEFMDQVPKRREVLIRLLDNATVGASIRAIQGLLDRGELILKADPTRIRLNINRLAGPPRGFENAVQRLQDSGENAVPLLIETMRDAQRKAMLQPVLRCLPLIDRPGLNPLVMALRMNDPAAKVHVIEALGKIGYTQSASYLLQLAQDEQAGSSIREAATQALSALRTRGLPVDPAQPAAKAFYQLAEGYHADRASLAADGRLELANVWYWRDDMLVNIEVPSAIFNEIMCMRCCEEALRLDPSMKPALALWLAANFRREAQLPAEQVDGTRPDNYPPAEYFAQAAGAEYCLMALARAVREGDPAVALGAIAALRTTGGPASLVNDADGQMPLAGALSFADRMVRVRAGLTLGGARPVRAFHNYQNLMPVLSEALALHAGQRGALVIDPDSGTANEIGAMLREQGYETLTDAGLYSGLQKARDELAGLDVVFIASDITGPDLTAGLDSLRAEFRFASTPVVVVTKPGAGEAVRDLVQADYRLGSVPAGADRFEVDRVVAAVTRSVGAQPITPEVGASLAREAAEVLRLLALTSNTLLDISAAEVALIDALTTEDRELRVAVAEDLGYLGSRGAQEAIAEIALDTAESEEMRVLMFSALAEAAKRRGNLLGDDLLEQIIKIAESDENMTIREAGSRALGALNVPGEPASVIIRNQYRG